MGNMLKNGLNWDWTLKGKTKRKTNLKENSSYSMQEKAWKTPNIRKMARFWKVEAYS